MLSRLTMGTVMVGCFAFPGVAAECSNALQGPCPDRPPGGVLDVPAGISISPPIAVTPVADGLAAKMSLSTWRDYNASRLAYLVTQSSGHSGLPLPKSPRVASPLDLWTRVQVAGFADEHQSGLGYEAGADYKFGGAATIGVFGSFADASRRSASAGDLSAQDAIGAHAVFLVSPTLSIEARGRWFAPADDPRPETPADAGADTNAISVAPRLSQKFLLSGGETIEPFLSLRSELRHDPYSSNSFSPSAAGGFTIHNPDAYSLSFSTSVDNAEKIDEEALVNSRVQLQIPLP